MLSLGWLTAVTAGHTKRVTMNAIMLCAYCIGNIIGPQRAPYMLSIGVLLSVEFCSVASAIRAPEPRALDHHNALQLYLPTLASGALFL